MSSEPIRSKLSPFATAAECRQALDHAATGRDLQIVVDRAIRARFDAETRELLQVAFRRRWRELGLIMSKEKS